MNVSIKVLHLRNNQKPTKNEKTSSSVDGTLYECIDV